MFVETFRIFTVLNDSTSIQVIFSIFISYFFTADFPRRPHKKWQEREFPFSSNFHKMHHLIYSLGFCISQVLCVVVFVVVFFRWSSNFYGEYFFIRVLAIFFMKKGRTDENIFFVCEGLWLSFFCFAGFGIVL